jgi:hypothetical protein
MTGFAPWNPARTGAYHAEHVALRRRLLKAGRGHVCERCGEPGKTTMHHVRPENRAECVQFLCSPCHRAVDSKARG